MKKSAFLMALAIAGGMASCAQGPKANMKNEVDTLSYMMGVSNTQGLQDYALGRMGIDSAHYADFVRGIEQGMKETDAKEKAYLMGMQIGQQVSGQMFDAINNQVFEGDSVNSLTKDNFLAGFIAGVKDQAIVPVDSASLYVRTQVDAIKEKALEAKYADYKKENEEFLANNKSKEGIKVTPSGLQYKVLKELRYEYGSVGKYQNTEDNIQYFIDGDYNYKKRERQKGTLSLICWNEEKLISLNEKEKGVFHGYFATPAACGESAHDLGPFEDLDVDELKTKVQELGLRI